MQLAWLLLGLTLSADPALPDCDDDLDSCRETCSLQFGTAMSTRGQLGVCFDNCRDAKNRCNEVHKEAALEKRRALKREQDIRQRAELEREDRDQELFKQRATMEGTDGGTRTQLGTARTAPAPAPTSEIVLRPPAAPAGSAPGPAPAKSADPVLTPPGKEAALHPAGSDAKLRDLPKTSSKLPELPKLPAKVPELPSANLPELPQGSPEKLPELPSPSKLPEISKSAAKAPELPKTPSKVPELSKSTAKKVGAAPPADDEGLAPMDDLIKDSKKPTKKPKQFRSVFPNSANRSE